MRASQTSRRIAAAAIVLIGSLAGCGGATKTDVHVASTATAAAAAEAIAPNSSARQILESATEASAQATSVAVRGHSTLGQHLKSNLVLRLTRTGGEGSFDALGNRVALVRVDSDLYLKGSAELYQRLGVQEDVPADTWIHLPATSTQLGALTDLAGETGRLLSTSGRVSKGKQRIIDGQPAIELKTSGKLYSGRLFVKATGAPYPLRLEKHGKETATYTFTNWDEVPAPKPPGKSMAVGG